MILFGEAQREEVSFGPDFGLQAFFPYSCLGLTKARFGVRY